jgi:succinate dehydrogenase/fumarate reductase flavoprotein subunit
LTTAHADRIRADLVIIGAGGTGLTAASIALESGARNIVLLEKASTAGGNTAQAAGMFAGTISAQCIKRRGEPKELVEAAVFLASDGAGFITGQLLIVDGGAAFS